MQTIKKSKLKEETAEFLAGIGNRDYPRYGETSQKPKKGKTQKQKN